MNKLDTIKETVAAVIIDVMGIQDKKTLEQSDTLIDALEVDSLAKVEIIIMIEAEFDIEISDDAINHVVTVQDLTELVEDLVEVK